jgi:uncharacterized protein (DUF2147 family)
MRKIVSRAAMLTTALWAAMCWPAFAGEPSGTWLTEGGQARVQVANCGGALCGSIVWLAEPNEKDAKPKLDKNNPDTSKRSRSLIGIQIMFGMKPSGPDKWSGQVYSPEDGNTYSGSLTDSGANALKLEGCVLGGLICRSQAWTRVDTAQADRAR